MLVNVEQIRDQPLSVRQPLTQAFVSEVLQEAPGGWAARSASELEARFEPAGKGELRLSAKASLPLVAECHRCLTEVKAELPISFSLHLVRQTPATPPEAEGEDDSEGSETAGTFDLADADDEPFDGKQVELNPLVREQILLNLPMRALCKESCKGLCSNCGKNLNEVECGCVRKSVDPRLAALQNIKL